MAQSTVLTEARYTRLLKDIRKIIADGKQQAAAVARKELVNTYWEVGRRISEESLTENAGYGNSVLEDLSNEIGIDVSTLKRCVYFFQTYNSATGSTNLTWSHYKYLLSINDDQERQWYEQAAEEEKWSIPRLGKAIKEDRYARSQKNKGKKAPAPKLTRPTEPTYIYKAVVDRVIDGDTMILRIDLGFQVWKEQRVRLAEIDAPALDEPGGKEATRYVRDQLARVEFVMVKTNKIDVHGRYVGHVFYSFKNLRKEETFTKGRYLNQELVQKGLARMF